MPRDRLDLTWQLEQRNRSEMRVNRLSTLDRRLLCFTQSLLRAVDQLRGCSGIEFTIRRDIFWHFHYSFTTSICLSTTSAVTRSVATWTQQCCSPSTFGVRD